MISISLPTEKRGLYRLSTEVLVPQSRERAFECFGDALNLEAITPPWLHFAVLTPPPIKMRVGTLIDYRLRLHRIPIRWRTKITCWEPPFRFIDEQIRGPYRLWRHLHTVEEDADGCMVRDQVDYAVPGGRWGGTLLHALMVRRDVHRIFEYRRSALLRRFATKSPQPG